MPRRARRLASLATLNFDFFRRCGIGDSIAAGIPKTKSCRPEGRRYKAWEDYRRRDSAWASKTAATAISPAWTKSTKRPLDKRRLMARPRNTATMMKGSESK